MSIKFLSSICIAAGAIIILLLIFPPALPALALPAWAHDAAPAAIEPTGYYTIYYLSIPEDIGDHLTRPSCSELITRTPLTLLKPNTLFSVTLSRFDQGQVGFKIIACPGPGAVTTTMYAEIQGTFSAMNDGAYVSYGERIYIPGYEVKKTGSWYYLGGNRCYFASNSATIQLTSTARLGDLGYWQKSVSLYIVPNTPAECPGQSGYTATVKIWYGWGDSLPPEPPVMNLFKPVRGISAASASPRTATYSSTVLVPYSTTVHAPAPGKVLAVGESMVEISSTLLGLYRVLGVAAPSQLVNTVISAACVLGYYDGAPGGVEVQTVNDFHPSLDRILNLEPGGQACSDGWKCYREIVKYFHSYNPSYRYITVTLPARMWPDYNYFLRFDAQQESGKIAFDASNPRADTSFYTWINDPNDPNRGWVWGPGMLQFAYPERRMYEARVSFTVGTNQLNWTLNSAGALDLHQVCVSTIGGGVAGICPPPREVEWHPGGGAEFDGAGRAMLDDGEFIWKEATIILPPSPQSSPGGLEGVGTGEVEPAAISGKYDVRVLARALAGTPALILEKEMAPGVWKELGRSPVATDTSYLPFSVQFDVGQQYLVIRLRADGGGVRIDEVCADEERKEAELISPCFGINPYNPPEPGCNLLECPGRQVLYNVQKLHDVALLPPLCKIAYWINYLYYYALTTVGKPILQYLTTIIELIREFGIGRGIVEALRILLQSLWVSLIKPYGTQILNLSVSSLGSWALQRL